MTKQSRATVPFYVWPVIFVGVVAIGYTIAWHIAADRMEEAIASWITDQRENGLTVEHGDITTAGYPFFLRGRVDTPTIAEAQRWQWSAPRLMIDILPFSFDRIILSPQGAQDIAVTLDGTAPINLRVTAEKLRASLGTDKNTDWFFAFDGADINIAGQGPEFSGTLDNVTLNLVPSGQDLTTLSLGLRATGFHGSAHTPTSNGQTSEHQLTIGSLDSAIALTRTDTLEESPYHWQRANGALQIGHIIVTNEPAQLAITGAVSLDSNMTPAGTIETRMVKPAPFLTVIRELNVFEPEMLAAINGAVTLATVTGGGAIEKTFVLSDGSVKMDGQEIARLSPIQ